MSRSPPASLTGARTQLQAHFSGPESEHPDRWSKLWDAGNFLPWDRGLPQPALVDLLSGRHNLIGDCYVEDGSGGQRRKKALVPGCGRGYDVLLLASFGYDAYGLEVSESAVKRCKEEQTNNAHKYPVKNEAAGAGIAKFVNGNFFGETWLKDVDGDGKFELIFDYTASLTLHTQPVVASCVFAATANAQFLCALPPSFRPSWSLHMSQLLAPAPAANLICLEFPTYKDPSLGGPPFGLSPAVYVEHLSHPGEELPYDDKGHIKQNPLRRASPGGLERVAHWQPERTHEIGKGTDWVSVWRHQ